MTKGKQTWEKTHIDCRLRSIKLNMWVKTKWLEFVSCFPFFSMVCFLFFLHMNENVCHLKKKGVGLGLLFCHYKFGNWVIFFQDTMIFCLTITLCYSWQIMVLVSCVPFPSIWATCEAILKQLSFIVTRCVMN